MTTEFSGVLTADDTYIRPEPSNGGRIFTSIVAGSTTFNYFTEDFLPSVSGDYSIEVTAATLTISNDPFLFIYTDSFDPNDPLTNFLVGNDDSPTSLLSLIDSVTLDSSTQYIIVMTSFLPGSTGPVTFAIVGPGGVTVGAPVIDGSQPSFDETSPAALADPVTFAGGTFQPGATTTLGQAIVVEVTGGTVDANGQVVSFTGAITGAGTLAVTGAGQLVVTGSASNDGGFTVESGGTLLADGTISGPVVIGATGTLGGTGTLSGPLTFAGGTFQPGSAMSLGQAIAVEAAGGTVDANGQVVSFTGPLTGAGTLAVTGPGQLVVTGAASNDGGFMVGSGGTLLADGTISGPVVVDAGGTLGGTGTVSGPVAVAGTIAPGDSPGTLTVAAPVVLVPGGALEIEIDGTGTGNGAGNFDRLVVTGAGNSFTANGTLEVALRGIGAPANNDFTPSVGQVFVIVDAEGGIVGTFVSVAQPDAGLPAGTRFDTIYGANQITLRLTPSSYADLAAAGLTQSENERAVGAALEELREPAGIPAAGDLGLAFEALAPLGDGQIQSALDSLGPELHADMMLAGVSTRRLFGELLFDHLAALRRDSELTGGLGPLTQMRFAFDTPPAGADAIEPAAGPAPAGSHRAILWGQAAGSFGNTDGDDNGAGFDRQTGALMVGAEAAIADHLIGGVGIGFGRSWVDADADLGDGTVNSYQAVLYGGAGFGDSYAQASVGYGFAQYDTKRDITLGALSEQASGEANGHDLAVDTEVGHAFALDPVTLELHGGLRWDRLYRDDFTEDDAGDLDLDVDSETLNSVRSTLGARISLPLELGEILLRPELSFGWRHEWADQTAKASAALGGADIQVEATEVGRDAGYVGLGVAARLTERLRLFADAEAEFRKDDRDGQVVLGIAFAW